MKCAGDPKLYAICCDDVIALALRKNVVVFFLTMMDVFKPRSSFTGCIFQCVCLSKKVCGEIRRRMVSHHAFFSRGSKDKEGSL